MAAPVPDWLLERYAADDLAPDRAEAVRRDLEADPGGPARLEALRADDRAILASYPPARVVAEVARRARLGRRSRRIGWVAVPALAAAVALVAVIRPAPDVPLAMEDGIRDKGLEPGLRLHRRTAAGAEPLPDGALARSGDVLQVSVVPAGRPWAVVVSVDGRGTVTRHFPPPGVAPSLPAEGASALPEAWELDDAPGFERFFLVTAHAPLDPETVEDAARALATDPPQAALRPLALPPGWEQTSFLVRKHP
ncbi:MAG: ActD-like protein [Deltaproteobacteria bacterium]|nr:ActD-like protein [Deltaproteobacteria bacterium]